MDKPVVDPEVVARKVAAMSLGRAQAREARLAAEAQLLGEVMSLDLAGLRAAPARASGSAQWARHRGDGAGDCTAPWPEGGQGEHRIRKHPVARRLVQLIQDHQLQLVLRGEFGVQAQAKAARA